MKMALRCLRLAISTKNEAMHLGCAADIPIFSGFILSWRMAADKISVNTVDVLLITVFDATVVPLHVHSTLVSQVRAQSITPIITRGY
jgi:hypothetical protein